MKCTSPLGNRSLVDEADEGPERRGTTPRLWGNVLLDTVGLK